MSIEVNSFDVNKAEEEIKKCHKIVSDYVKLLKEQVEHQKKLTTKAILKIKEQAKKYLLTH